jgi:hypothetical protein
MQKRKITTGNYLFKHINHRSCFDTCKSRFLTMKLDEFILIFWPTTGPQKWLLDPEVQQRASPERCRRPHKSYQLPRPENRSVRISASWMAREWRTSGFLNRTICCSTRPLIATVRYVQANYSTQSYDLLQTACYWFYDYAVKATTAICNDTRGLLIQRVSLNAGDFRYYPADVFWQSRAFSFTCKWWR